VTQTRTEAPSARTASAGRGGRIGRFLREVISDAQGALAWRHELVTYTIVVDRLLSWSWVSIVLA
jgi:hypothetical protein